MECSICSTEVDPEFMNLCACCGDPTVEGTRFCQAHIDQWCIDCGRHATHDCDGFNGGYICGLPLCDKCQHTH